MLNESVIEQAALDWLSELGWNIKNGGEIAPDMPAAERNNYREVVLEKRLRDA